VCRAGFAPGGFRDIVRAMTHPTRIRMLTLAALLTTGALVARSPAQQVSPPVESPAPARPSPPPQPPPEARQFDFWVGEWDVTTADSKVAGRNRIELILDGRALQEHWTGTGGVAGTSLNLFDTEAKKWRQFWIDGTGGSLQLTGGLVDGRMVLEGTGKEAGKTLHDRITWTPNPDGSVRQLWERSEDNRATWFVVFDGLYRKK
jgi:hypothetical protein